MFSAENTAVKRLADSVRSLKERKTLGDRHGVADNIREIYDRLHPLIVDYSLAIREQRDDDAKRIFERVVTTLEGL